MSKLLQGAGEPNLSIRPLAEKIEQDIRSRSLRPGDRYLTSQQVAELMKVSCMTASRAMQGLARRQIVVRRRKSGTFVGPGIATWPIADQEQIYLLFPHDYLETGGEIPGALLAGIREKLGNVNVQLVFLPVENIPSYLKGLTDYALSSRALSGFVLLRATRDARQFFNERSFPIVIMGHTESDIKLPWIDRDQRQMGVQATKHLIAKKHRRMALIMRERWAPGDNLLVEGVMSAITSARLGADALALRSVPAEAPLIRNSIEQLLESTDRPTALICRSETIATCALEVAQKMKLGVPDDVLIFSCGESSAAHPLGRILPHAVVDFLEVGQLIGTMLQSYAAGGRPKPDHYELPVRIQAWT